MDGIVAHAGMLKAAPGGGGTDPDADTLIAAMSTPPDSTRNALYQTAVIGLKSAGLWSLIDEMWVMAAHTEQAGLLGWKRLSDCTKVSTVTHTVDRGTQRAGGTSYLNTNLSPIGLTNYQQDSGTLGIYSRTDANETTADFGVRLGATFDQATILTRMSGNVNVRVNTDSAPVIAAIADSLGLITATRIDASTVEVYKEGALHTSGTSASSLPHNGALFIHGCNQNGSATLLSTRQLSLAFIGAEFTSTQQADFYNVMVAGFLNSIGAKII